ncbi:MAG TPA: hypothetical protein VHT27_02190 [Solirubrobacteraceae bacterium]|nr:hypothetical protein [Solirubrobacteraceae bacterium]
MAATVTFERDGTLREGPDEIARVEAGPSREFGTLTVGSRTCDIVRKRRSGWHFELVEAASERVVCVFHPHALRRGGTIRAEDNELKLKPTLSSRGWTITSPGRPPIRAQPRVAATLREEAALHAGAGSGGIAPELVLRFPHTVPLAENARMWLAFACWLIAQWEAAQSDHSWRATNDQLRGVRGRSV